MTDKNQKPKAKTARPWWPFVDRARWERDMDRIMEECFGQRTKYGRRDLRHKNAQDRRGDTKGINVKIEAV